MPLEGPKTVWAGLGSCWGIIGPLQGQGTGWKRLVMFAGSGLVWACSLIVFYSVWFSPFVCCNTLGGNPTGVGWFRVSGLCGLALVLTPSRRFVCRVGVGSGCFGIGAFRWCWWIVVLLVLGMVSGAGAGSGSGMAQEWLRIRNQPTGWKGAGSVN